MTYTVKEIYYTIQGEGAQTGRAAVFCRFSGCNLWSGLEKDRDRAICSFCDTDFVGTNGPGGGKFDTVAALAEAIAGHWPQDAETSRPYVVFTGGEPLLQLDENLVRALHEKKFEVGVETNGTVRAPEGLDWICVSPKASASVVQRQGSELKLVYPQSEALPERFELMDFKFFFLQPMDGAEREHNTRLVIEYCKAHPLWRVSLQTHKLVGIP
ncbi:MAG: 7-carboxy-7-deazaguanine synthase [Pseudomonadales bacterium]